MATYYVAPSGGNDDGPGTYASPWATLQESFWKLVAGDTLIMRGGDYHTTWGTNAGVHIWFNNDTTGTSSNHITIRNSAGETPIFNFNNFTSTSVYGDTVYILSMSGAEYVDITGLKIANYTQRELPAGSGSGAAIAGIAMYGCSNCTFNQVDVYNIGGYGIKIENSYSLTFNNCDVHHCVDRYSMKGYDGDPMAPYENANGFNITTGDQANTTDIIFNTCRAWKNSDDGWDFFGTDGKYTLNGCWSFWNGYDDSFNELGDGQGFKCGPRIDAGVGSNLRIYNNCLAVGNKTNGFDQNTSGSYGTNIHHFNNCAAFSNGNIGFAFNYSPYQNTANIFRNNISYLNGSSAYSYGSVPPVVSSNNSWTIPVAYNSADFLSVTIVGLDSARQAGGILPSLTLLRPSAGSNLKLKGMVIPNNENPTDTFGNAWASTPTIGPFEYVGGVVAPSVTTSSTINITSTTATGGGNVTSNGGGTISARGVCWGLTTTPNISGSHTTESGTIGSFTSSITGLTPSTQYYVRAYATNEIGTTYGSATNFTTLASGQVITISGTSISTERDVFSGFSIVPSTLTVINNRIYESVDTSYQLKAGDEGPYSTLGYLDNAIITGNKFEWNVSPRSNASLATHQLFTGYNINSTIKYNYHSPGAVYCVVLKSGTSGVSRVDTTGCVAYNIYKDFFEGVLCRGISGIRIYNNTFYNSVADLNGCVVIEENDGSGGNAPSQNIKIKNNIFYTVDYQCVINVRQPSGMVGLDSNYNIFYSESGNMWFYDGTNYYIGLANWQAGTGQDMDSIVVDPNFIDTVNFVPSARLNGGTNLGSEFQTGLSSSATWSVGSTPATTNQDSTWQIGARILGSSVVIPTLSTTTISGITYSSASSGGNITSDGGGSVTSRGVCWSTSSSPTISDSKTTNGTGSGTYTSSITGLNPNILYYVRAYATNSAGTAYGNQLSFTTSKTTPTVTLNAITSITSISAISGGNVTLDGGDSVTVRGVCWNTSSTPTVSNSHTSNGTGTGTFTSSITGLSPNTLYYVRAYATNNTGTSYSTQSSFTTSVGGFSGISIPNILIHKASIYNPTEVIIGTQTWKTRNVDNNITGSKVYNNDEANRTIYGGLYDYTMVSAIEALYPGWHLPTQTDCNTLRTFLGGSLSTAGGKLKETGTSHWLTPNNGATNSTGFSGLPGGCYSFSSYTSLNTNGMFLGKTVGTTGFHIGITLDYSLYTMSVGDLNDLCYWSVRLIKD